VNVFEKGFSFAILKNKINNHIKINPKTTTTTKKQQQQSHMVEEKSMMLMVMRKRW